MSVAPLDICFEPCALGGADFQNGFRYCLRHGGTGICVEHGLVFGPKENILLELGREFQGAPLTPAPAPIRHFGLCHLKPEPKEYRRIWPKRTGRTALELRIYQARMKKLFPS